MQEYEILISGVREYNYIGKDEFSKSYDGTIFYYEYVGMKQENCLGSITKQYKVEGKHLLKEFDSKYPKALEDNKKVKGKLVQSYDIVTEQSYIVDLIW